MDLICVCVTLLECRNNFNYPLVVEQKNFEITDSSQKNNDSIAHFKPMIMTLRLLLSECLFSQFDCMLTICLKIFKMGLFF